MGTSIYTAISPPIPLSRRVINDIEEHQRRVLDSYVEGMNRGMNTSPVQSSDEQEKEITATMKGPKGSNLTSRNSRRNTAAGDSRN